MSQKLRSVDVIQVILAYVEYRAIMLDCLVVTEKPHFSMVVNSDFIEG